MAEKSVGKHRNILKWHRAVSRAVESRAVFLIMLELAGFGSLLCSSTSYCVDAGFFSVMLVVCAESFQLFRLFLVRVYNCPVRDGKLGLLNHWHFITLLLRTTKHH